MNNDWKEEQVLMQQPSMCSHTTGNRYKRAQCPTCTSFFAYVMLMRQPFIYQPESRREEGKGQGKLSHLTLIHLEDFYGLVSCQWYSCNHIIYHTI